MNKDIVSGLCHVRDAFRMDNFREGEDMMRSSGDTDFGNFIGCGLMVLMFAIALFIFRVTFWGFPQFTP